MKTINLTLTAVAFAAATAFAPMALANDNPNNQPQTVYNAAIPAQIVEGRQAVSAGDTVNALQIQHEQHNR